MQSITSRVTERISLKPALWQISLAADGLIPAQPGQFYLAQCGNSPANYLRRAVFPAFAPGEPPGLRLTFSASQLTDPGLAWLAARQIGEPIDLLGPLGTGFAIPQLTRNLLLIGNSAHVEPLLTLANLTLSRKINVVLALESLRAATLFPVDTLPPAVELRLATLDGSIGHRGHILAHLGDLGLWADALCAVGSVEFYRELKVYLERQRPTLTTGFAQVLRVDAPIHICGTGVCTRCAIQTTTGTKMACSDGPVFDLATLTLEGAL